MLDSNVIVSGVIYPLSKPGTILRYWEKRYYRLAISTYILREVEYALAEPKITSKYQLLSSDIHSLVNGLKNYSKLVRIQPSGHLHIRDPKDSEIVATALVSHANYLVTGDKDILTFTEQPKSLQIITPSHFHSLITNS